jgi:hypothetical protein
MVQGPKSAERGNQSGEDMSRRGLFTLWGLGSLLVSAVVFLLSSFPRQKPGRVSWR